jgi:hypothetical protein
MKRLAKKTCDLVTEVSLSIAAADPLRPVIGSVVG